MQSDTNLEFPCDFTFKVIGEASTQFEGDVLHIFRKYFPKLGEAAVTIKPSKNNKYISLSIDVHAESKEQLDNTYLELTNNPLVLFAL
jgi:putative lipoic acid-binding regulatory protein